MEEKGQAVEIIRLLRKGRGYTSGEALSSTLGISRSAVWKHVENLRGMGFGIEASPSKGYRLAPGKAVFNAVEVSASLDTGFIGRELHFHRRIGSTNAEAFDLGRAGAPEGAAVIADEQTLGRGRLGRRWASPPGVNLYTSVILRPMIPPRDAHHLTFVAAVAVAEAVARVSPRRPSVKWPNDVLVDGRKVAGILLEMDSEADHVNFVVVGMGVNLNMGPNGLPSPLRASAASLMGIGGVEVSRSEFVCALYSSLEKWYKGYTTSGFARALSAWRGYFASEGRPVKVASLGRALSGICAGVDADGALLVRAPSGAIERVISGDVAEPAG
jgi:BirA family biotin operon repressor/biotin-[acetyl-CoA-carboxylase] ligase